MHDGYGQFDQKPHFILDNIQVYSQNVFLLTIDPVFINSVSEYRVLSFQLCRAWKLSDNHS